MKYTTYDVTIFATVRMTVQVRALDPDEAIDLGVTSAENETAANDHEWIDGEVETVVVNTDHPDH